MTKLELAIRFGRTLLINEMNGIPAVLYPLIKGEIQVNGPRKTIHINDKHLDYNDTFCL
jgi:dynein heavy chain 2